MNKLTGRLKSISSNFLEATVYYTIFNPLYIDKCFKQVYNMIKDTERRN